MNPEENRKKKNEQEILDKFREMWNDFPGGKIMLSESPDFILKLSPKRAIGIELTQIYGRNRDETSLSRESIDDCLRKKGEKLRIYRKKRLDSYWLIITIDQTDQVPYKLSNKIRTWKFQANFDRIFLFNYSEEKIYELRLQE